MLQLYIRHKQNQNDNDFICSKTKFKRSQNSKMKFKVVFASFAIMAAVTVIKIDATSIPENEPVPTPSNYLAPIPLNKCEKVEKLGCFQDNIHKRVLKDQLVANTRDEYNNKFRYPILDWNNWNNSTQILACRCARSARNLGHKFFGLQFYGECWSGQQLNYKRYGKAPEDGCVGDHSPADLCKDDDQFCVGKQYNNYVYRLPNLCEKKYDLGFMLDSSGSITKKNYEKVLRFIANIANEFKVSSPKTHIALMHFATQSYMDIDFKNPIAQKQNQLQRKVRKMTKEHSGRTYTKTALVEASKSMFCETCGTRKNVKKVLVVFTDGKSNDKGELKNKSFDEIKEGLKKQNVRIIAVGIDNKIDLNELKEIASSRKVVDKNGKEKTKYDAMKFQTRKLFRKLKQIVGEICE